MANLATHLQQQFSQHCPPGWHADAEVKVLSNQVSRLLGYAPKVDILLERDDGSRRLWIQFEINAVDPVANHAKFATAHLFEPQSAGDAFLSMVGPHVGGERRSLAANTVLAMRRLGMAAYQTLLLPHYPKAEIERLNSLSLEALSREQLDAGGEITRALSVALPALQGPKGNIHFAANILEVLLNVYRWNLDLQTDAGRARWGRRTVSAFVYDPRFHHFAPARFAAYVPVAPPGEVAAAGLPAGMTVRQYARVQETKAIADGSRARRHLVGNLAMRLIAADSLPSLYRAFSQWLVTCQDAVDVHPAGPQVILPPIWF